MSTSPSAVARRYGWYLAVLQLFFTLCWTIYVIYLPKLAAGAGLPARMIIFILMLDQLIFTVCDFATGIAADKMTRILGRLGTFVIAATALSCAAFLAMPLVAGKGAAPLIALIVIWTVTSSALRAPPLMLLGKYAAKPSIPHLSSLAMLGYGIAGALAPYLATALREVDPRWPFALASLALVLTAFGMIAAERAMAGAAPPQPRVAPARTSGGLTAPATVFALAMIAFALGYQIHSVLNSAPLFLRFAKPAELQWLMPVFWIGFNVAMFPASLFTKRFGGYAVMGASGLIGALAILAAHAAQSLDALVVAQLIAGSAWGAILMSAFSAAFAIGENGAEGRMAGLLFSALALATLARVTAVATGISGDPTLQAALQWMPAVCWAIAGAAVLYVAIAGLRRWTSLKA